MFGYFTIRAGSKLFGETEGFHFKDEGWFGKDTEYVGVDKFAHAWNSYLAAEILHNRLHRKTNASEGDAVTAAALAFGFIAYNEISDAIEPDSGWSMNDVVMNGLGAGFSVLRNTVPGLKEKVAFKIEIVPNQDFWTYSGPRRFEQQRFMFSLKGAGFRQLEETPLRFLDLQLGYGAEDFEPEERAAGNRAQAARLRRRRAERRGNCCSAARGQGSPGRGGPRSTISRCPIPRCGWTRAATCTSDRLNPCGSAARTSAAAAC